ncbi:hypothetical protein K493DRAFT_320085 [Basidiobolus meristosporus CBS 931.73]|uniref:LITAF domain-containing protein n=1 Tax=Basidiobolus meristosporus CBS 931.73 TaxID=1314790 RepID=A0A1Y1XFT6_9FUNG|nr:hypothetical protein K493DRAFT_320085 [Basidiobolus meristosporus CBS 931.73]|eukprot:ORX84629.1 hypothetical protein K493DRAFT_320085 [Basidiobolus meristosporus CBS 931.73]
MTTNYANYREPSMSAVSSASLPIQLVPAQLSLSEQNLPDSVMSELKHRLSTLSPPRPSLELALPPNLRRFHSLRKVRFRDIPLRIQCPNCHKYCTTNLKHKNGSAVWLAAFGLFILTGVFFWVPFMTRMCKDVVHECPHCQRHIGRYRRL